MTIPSDQPHDSTLHPADAAAIDALVAARMNPSRVPSEHRARAERIAGLLRALEAGESVGPEAERLIQATLSRIVAARAEQPAPAGATGWVRESGHLHPADEDALEALIGADYNPARVVAGMRLRAARHAALLALLQPSALALGDTAGRDDLIGRTLAGVQRAVDDQSTRMRLDPVAARVGGRLGGGWRIGDLIAVAAMLLIGAAITMPAISASRDSARQNACHSNLAAAGLGFGLYAGDFRNALPIASASAVGQPWWLVGEGPERSNSANLFTLARASYTRTEELACAAAGCDLRGCPPQGMMDWSSLKQVTYSYQNMFAAQRRAWISPDRQEVLADRSPVILRARAGQWIDPFENSPNHGGRGQIVLYNDGSAVWLLTPINQHGDNIWLPRPIETVINQLSNPRKARPLTGTEAPEGTGDTFLAP